MNPTPGHCTKLGAKWSDCHRPFNGLQMLLGQTFYYCYWGKRSMLSTQQRMATPFRHAM